MLACPSQAWTLAISASCSKALVAAVAPESMDAKAVDLNPGLLRVGRHHAVNAAGRNAGTGPLAAQWNEQRHFSVRQMMP